MDTNYRANNWTDARNPDRTLVNNRISTIEEIYSTAATQVEKVATFFTGAAATWWRNLPVHPLTWETRVAVDAVVPGDNNPGWEDHEEAIGLKELLLRQF